MSQFQVYLPSFNTFILTLNFRWHLYLRVAITHEAGVDAGAGHQAGEVGGVGAGDTLGSGGGAGGPAAVWVSILGVIPLPAPAGGVAGLGSAGLEP